MGNATRVTTTYNCSKSSSSSFNARFCSSSNDSSLEELAEESEIDDEERRRRIRQLQVGILTSARLVMPSQSVQLFAHHVLKTSSGDLG